MYKALRLSFVIVALSCAGIAQAGVACDGYVAGRVTPTDSCELGSVNNDNPMPGQVNDDDMFGHDDWEFLDKPFDSPPGGGDPVFSDSDWSGDTMSGSWTIPASIWEMWDQVMVVFKGGNGQNIDPSEYVGYLVSSGAELLEYLTPFMNLNSENDAGISHISVYVRGPRSVPEPGTLALLGLGLVGLGFVRQRKVAIA